LGVSMPLPTSLTASRSLSGGTRTTPCAPSTPRSQTPTHCYSNWPPYAPLLHAVGRIWASGDAFSVSRRAELLQTQTATVTRAQFVSLPQKSPHLSSHTSHFRQTRASEPRSWTRVPPRALSPNYPGPGLRLLPPPLQRGPLFCCPARTQSTPPASRPTKPSPIQLGLSLGPPLPPPPARAPSAEQPTLVFRSKFSRLLIDCFFSPWTQGEHAESVTVLIPKEAVLAYSDGRTALMLAAQRGLRLAFDPAWRAHRHNRPHSPSTPPRTATLTALPSCGRGAYFINLLPDPSRRVLRLLA
jgi:hypothetical protein